MRGGLGAPLPLPALGVALGLFLAGAGLETAADWELSTFVALGLHDCVEGKLGKGQL